MKATFKEVLEQAYDDYFDNNIDEVRE